MPNWKTSSDSCGNADKRGHGLQEIQSALLAPRANLGKSRRLAFALPIVRQVALTTGTVIQPDAVPDLMWFETEAARILEEVFHQLGERRDSAGTLALTTSLHNHMGGMGQCLAVAEALQIFKAVVPKLRSQMGGEKITANEDASKAMNRLAASELYACALINILLGLSDELEKLKPDSIGTILGSVNWLKPETLYAGTILPRRAIQELESLRDCFDFEIRVEGKLISPEWLQIEMAGLAFARFLDDVTKPLLEEFEITFGNEVETQLRHTMLATLNDTLKRIGKQLDFEAQIEINGLPMRVDVTDALRKLDLGEVPFTEVMKAFEFR